MSNEIAVVYARSTNLANNGPERLARCRAAFNLQCIAINSVSGVAVVAVVVTENQCVENLKFMRLNKRETERRTDMVQRLISLKRRVISNGVKHCQHYDSQYC